MSRPPNLRAGFTLLEVLVATMIMGIAVVSLLSALSVSLRNAARLTDHDRMAMLGRGKMDEILIDYDLPLEAAFAGGFPPAVTGGREAGYNAALGVYEARSQALPGEAFLQRVVLHIWWKDGAQVHALDFEAFRRNALPPAARP